MNDASSAALADIVTIVSERSHLFSTTLRENLLLAAPTATTTAMWDALRAVRIDGVVYADYDGLDMPIDRLFNNPEASYNSEDLKRRVILARAILRHTKVYVFDYSQCDISNHEAEEIVKILRRIARYANVIVLMPNDDGISSTDEIATVESYRHVANDSSKNITQLNQLNESRNSQNSHNVEQAQQDSNKNIFLLLQVLLTLMK